MSREMVDARNNTCMADLYEARLVSEQIKILLGHNRAIAMTQERKYEAFEN